MSQRAIWQQITRQSEMCCGGRNE